MDKGEFSALGHTRKGQVSSKKAPPREFPNHLGKLIVIRLVLGVAKLSRVLLFSLGWAIYARLLSLGWGQLDPDNTKFV